jgi:hypothetical protein
LSGIVTNAEAGLRWLARSMPDQVKTTLEQILADGHRAGAKIDGDRTHRGAAAHKISESRYFRPHSPPLNVSVYWYDALSFG